MRSKALGILGIVTLLVSLIVTGLVALVFWKPWSARPAAEQPSTAAGLDFRGTPSSSGHSYRRPPALPPAAPPAPAATARAGGEAPSAGDAAREMKPPDPEEVRAALARFRRVLGQISREDLEKEQRRMTEFLERARQLQVPEPTVAPFVDEHGLRWNELTYPSGEVRYEIPPEGPRQELRGDRR